MYFHAQLSNGVTETSQNVDFIHSPGEGGCRTCWFVCIISELLLPRVHLQLHGYTFVSFSCFVLKLRRAWLVYPKCGTEERHIELRLLRPV